MFVVETHITIMFISQALFSTITIIINNYTLCAEQKQWWRSQQCVVLIKYSFSAHNVMTVQYLCYLQCWGEPAFAIVLLGARSHEAISKRTGSLCCSISPFTSSDCDCKSEIKTLIDVCFQ